MHRHLQEELDMNQNHLKKMNVIEWIDVRAIHYQSIPYIGETQDFNFGLKHQHQLNGT